MDDYMSKPIKINDLIKVINFWGEKKFLDRLAESGNDL